jgi:hypothetical protein
MIVIIRFDDRWMFHARRKAGMTNIRAISRGFGISRLAARFATKCVADVKLPPLGIFCRAGYDSDKENFAVLARVWRDGAANYAANDNEEIGPCVTMIFAAATTSTTVAMTVAAE